MNGIVLKHRKKFLISSVVIVLWVLVAVICSACMTTDAPNIKTVDLSSFIEVSYTNQLDGKGEMIVDIDRDILYEELGLEGDKVLLTALFEEIEYDVIGNNGSLKNGDSVTLKMSRGIIDEYGMPDDEFKKTFGIEFINNEIEYVVTGLQKDSNTYIDLWNYFEMNISGIDGDGIAFARRLFTEPLEFSNYDGTAQLIIYPTEQENIINLELKRNNDYLLYGDAKFFCPKENSYQLLLFKETTMISIGDVLTYYVALNLDASILKENGFVLITSREEHTVTNQDLGVPIVDKSEVTAKHREAVLKLISHCVENELTSKAYDFCAFENVIFRTPKNAHQVSNKCFALFSFYGKDSSDKMFGYIVLDNLYLDPQTKMLQCDKSNIKLTSWFGNYWSYEKIYASIADELEDPYYAYEKIPFENET